ncbi:MAG: hypothetical protein H6738_25655 [Alphaproteobacteria bacterium]|nr:hypothetical protein [Alphaproteobacteria bacterium]
MMAPTWRSLLTHFFLAYAVGLTWNGLVSMALATDCRDVRTSDGADADWAYLSLNRDGPGDASRDLEWWGWGYAEDVGAGVVILHKIHYSDLMLRRVGPIEGDLP